MPAVVVSQVQRFLVPYKGSPLVFVRSLFRSFICLEKLRLVMIKGGGPSHGRIALHRFIAGWVYGHLK